MKIHRKSFFLITCLLISFSFMFQCYPGKSHALSIKEETIMGQKFLMQIRRHYEIVNDTFVVNYINNLGHYLLQALETKHFAYRFYVINGNDLNAFAAPGGHLFFYTGLIEVLDVLDELVGVMCHEIAHVSARHIAGRIEQSKKVGLAQLAGIIAGVLIGGKAGSAMMMGSSAAGAQAQLNYTRNDERQADQLGYKYIDASGFNPRGFISSLDKIQRGQYFDMSLIPSYLLTHPTGPERMSNLDIMMSRYNPRPDNETTAHFRSLYPYFRAILRAKYRDPEEAEELFKKDLEKDPDSALANFGLGVSWKNRAEYGRAVEYFERALQAAPDSPIILQNLGETYQLEGNNREAIKVLGKALKADSRNQQALLLLANAYQNLEEYDRAIPLYERLTAMRPIMNNEVFHQLGVSYGRLGRLGRAHYNFGIYFRRSGEIKKAQFHFDKALEHAGGDSALVSRINRAQQGMKPRGK
jgi:predicted Zn-dependent protease